MFNSKMKYHDIYKNSSVVNDWGEKIKTPVKVKSVKMFIALNTYTNNITQNVELQEVTHTAVTSDKTLKKDMIVDLKYQIIYVNNVGTDSILYLKEVVKDGQ